MKISIHLKNGSVLRDCELHVEPEQRTSDILNDERPFLPVIRQGLNNRTVTVILSKDTIASVREETDEFV
jgi:hypothetical protein